VRFGEDIAERTICYRDHSVRTLFNLEFYIESNRTETLEIDRVGSAAYASYAEAWGGVCA
jgi:hypothetical protein